MSLRLVRQQKAPLPGGCTSLLSVEGWEGERRMDHAPETPVGTPRERRGTWDHAPGERRPLEIEPRDYE
jgi:hypothetical protein